MCVKFESAQIKIDNPNTPSQTQIHKVWCVAEGPSHALLWLYKESVFRGLSVWRCVTQRCEAACKTHRNRYGSQATAYMEGQPVLSHCVCAECLAVCCAGWRWRWRWRGVSECVSIPSVFLETTWYETACPLAHIAQDYQWVWASTNSPPTHPQLPPCTHTHIHILHTKTHDFSAATTNMHTCTHQTSTTTYGISFNPLFLLS